MVILGPIIRLQIQRSRLKVGEKPNRRYDPGPIEVVDVVRVSSTGVLGIKDGVETMDIHHAGHAETHNREGGNGLSVGFVGHYDLMRERFGNQVSIGCGGENLIVDVRRRVTAVEAAGGFVILGADEIPRLRLHPVRVAHPCRPFAGFLHSYQTVEPEILKESLRFLDDGMRGFYCVVEGDDVVEIRRGDLLAVQPSPVS